MISCRICRKNKFLWQNRGPQCRFCCKKETEFLCTIPFFYTEHHRCKNHLGKLNRIMQKFNALQKKQTKIKRNLLKIIPNPVRGWNLHCLLWKKWILNNVNITLDQMIILHIFAQISPLIRPWQFKTTSRLALASAWNAQIQLNMAFIHTNHQLCTATQVMMKLRWIQVVHNADSHQNSFICQWMRSNYNEDTACTVLFVWLSRSLTSREHASGYMRRPCEGHEMGCL